MADLGNIGKLAVGNGAWARRADMFYGVKSLSGTTKVLGTLAACIVTLIHDNSGRFVDRMISDSTTGVFLFSGLNSGPYSIEATDPSGSAQSQIYNGLIPGP